MFLPWTDIDESPCIGQKCYQNPQIFATNPQSFSRAIYFKKSPKIAEMANSS
jgi:hypothetical protein